jgi:hypothetical protein
VTPRTIENWDKKGAPPIAMRLLYLRDRKYIGYPGWDGFCFSHGNLYYRGKLFANPETLKSWRRCSK